MPTPDWMAVIRVYGSILYATRRWGNVDMDTRSLPCAGEPLKDMPSI